MPAYILRPGKTPGVALYTRSEDELLCRAEMLLLLERAEKEHSRDQQIPAYYDVDPSFSIAEFKRGYRGRAGEYKHLMGLRSRILAEGWPFPELPSPTTQ
jgi:hypothetical protein